MQIDEKALVELIDRELGVHEAVLTDPISLRRLQAQRIARHILSVIRPAFEAKESLFAELIYQAETERDLRLAESVRADAAEAKLAQAVEALEPLVAIADIFDQNSPTRPREGEIMSWIDHRCGERVLTVEMLQAARSASAAARGET